METTNDFATVYPLFYKASFGKCIINISQNHESNISVNCSQIFFSESKQKETIYIKDDFTCELVYVNLLMKSD